MTQCMAPGRQQCAEGQARPGQATAFDAEAEGSIGRAPCSIYEGLNVEREIRAVAEQKLGDTILVWDDSRLAAFAVCHCGEGTETGSGVCSIKFGAALPGLSAERNFNRLLEACEAFAAAQ